MKKLTVLLFMMLVSLNINAQDINPNEKYENEAKKLVAEMNQQVPLSEVEQKQVYDIDLNKRIKNAEIRKENAGDKEVIKEKVTAVNKSAYASLRKVLGADKLKIWTDYQKVQAEKR